LAEALAEEIADLRAVLVDRRYEQVGGAFARELADQLRQIRLDRAEPGPFEGVVELDLVRRQRLHLDDLGGTRGSHEVDDDRVGLGPVASPVDDAAGTRHGRFEPEQHAVEVLQRRVLQGTAGLTELLPVGNLGHNLAAAGSNRGRRPANVRPQLLVLERGARSLRKRDGYRAAAGVTGHWPGSPPGGRPERASRASRVRRR